MTQADPSHSFWWWCGPAWCAAGGAVFSILFALSGLMRMELLATGASLLAPLGLALCLLMPGKHRQGRGHVYVLSVIVALAASLWCVLALIACARGTGPVWRLVEATIGEDLTFSTQPVLLATKPTMTPQFSEPTNEQYTDLARMWLSISRLVNEEYGYTLDQSLDDLPYLQRVIDDDLIDRSDAYGARCIGFAFGRVIISNNEGFDWWVVNDEFGEDYAVRYGQSSFRLDATNLFLKRFSDGSDVSVADFYESLLNQFHELRGSFQ